MGVKSHKRGMFCCPNILTSPLQICMGTCLPHEITEENKKAKIQNSKIEQDLSEHARAEKNVVKILMLGTAESGKSTIVKQIKIIHSDGFSIQELMSFKPAVLDNLLTSMKIVLQGMGMLRINLANMKNKMHAQSILSCSQCLGDDQDLLPFVAHAFCSLWADQGVRAAAARGYEFELNDSALYFFENISRIIKPNYIPTETDVLRVRVRTCGIIETQFQVNEIMLRLYDVGGQRSERRKWLSCFDCIQVVLFVVALSTYDMTLLDVPSVNRLQESLELFSSICTNTVFQKTSLEQIAMWMLQPITSLPCSPHAAALASPCTTTTPPPQTPTTYSWPSTWSMTRLSRRTWQPSSCCEILLQTL
ncbi:guanine nucleotide-binding protein G(o) subunit alpha-like isoform X2 [Amphiprion ocellaris]|uniref:Uncharacterized protein n=1 Tax=Amphiprion ocellaris TaxID=80972 RepID=A0A3Q1D3C1_AMPOC|nr:guanine nucleotide-binding protein G(o) subunit alpha-like isoform X2 [Amphiprion ocellaris]